MFRSVVPNSGPVSGRTRLVISGVDLGGSAQEISIMLGDIPCEVITEEYVTGK